MIGLLHAWESYFSTGITLIIHLIELMGVVILVIGAVRGFFCYFSGRSSNIRLDLAESMALGLEFKLGGEILRTVIARDWNEILTVGAIILLRAALNFLIHWEISHIEHDEQVIQERMLAHAQLQAVQSQGVSSPSNNEACDASSSCQASSKQ